MEAVGKISTPAGAVSGDFDPQETNQHLRSAVLNSLAQVTDEFLRSPPFLEMMKQSLDASIGMRQQINELLTQLHHSTQGVARADFDSLMRCVREAERRAQGRLELMTVRLDEIGQRLAGLEKCARSVAQAAELKESTHV
jgi:hypothetical protein